MLLRDRIELVKREYGLHTATDLVDTHGTPIYQKVYRQLFSGQNCDITFDVLSVIMDKFDDLSSEWLVRGEGQMKRQTAPVIVHRQDIHSDGAPIAISQIGTAKVEDTKKEQQPEATAPVNVDEMFRNQDWSLVVSLIHQHDRELLELKDQRIADLEKELELLHLLFKSITNK